MVNVLFGRAAARLCLESCGRSLVATAVLLLSATAAIAGEPAAEPLESSEAAIAAAFEPVAFENAGEADAGLAIAETAPHAPDTAGALLAADPLPAIEPSATGMFRVDDLEASLADDATVQPVAADGLAQVTQVSDFSDVLPSDWAFQALSNLVESYGCIQGYPDSTFWGQRSLTRFEFAAGLNACLDVIVSTLGTGVSEEDLAVIRRLQEEFAAELASLGGRVDQLEAETAELRAQQFSTVTKLRGQVFSNIGGGFSNGNVLAETGTRVGGVPATRTVVGDPGITVANYLWLNLDTSFSGADRLKLQLVSGSGTGVGNFWTSSGLFNTFGTPIQFQGGVPGNNFDVYIRELSYAFPVGNSITVDVGPRVNWYSYFDNNRYTFFLTGANSFNSSGGTQVNAVDRGTGAIAVWNVTDWLDVRVGYLAENTEFIGGNKAPSDPSIGLFGGTSTLTGQVGIRPFNNFNLRFLYTRSNLTPDALGRVGGTFGEPIYGLADDGAGGALTNAPADTFLVNFDWTPLNWLGLFGRYTYGSVDLTSATTRASLGSIDAQSFQFGVAFPNLFKEGAQATISYLVPFSVISGRQFLVSGGGNGGRQQELELVYRYPVNRNLYLMPSAIWIMDANNFSTNPDIFIFNMQAQLLF
ncbi:carbohydrate porin [Nodosilinea sp. LEGE 06152]|uniref:iron uptake porin n=1 Tax=Nodosilinea sp. LEGE 06152 TaxID=2777966 RepID=UPI00187E8673|nr:iron uptake porin [Nodosilinea sp. LEGE 06152]MBE9160265.1 carbohydrate porin [Nodosilinea sp. LEGE 06152]